MKKKTKQYVYVHPLDETKEEVPRNLLAEVYNKLPKGQLADQLLEYFYKDER